MHCFKIDCWVVQSGKVTVDLELQQLSLALKGEHAATDLIKLELPEATAKLEMGQTEGTVEAKLELTKQPWMATLCASDNSDAAVCSLAGIEGRLTLEKTVQGTAVKLEDCKLETAKLELTASGDSSMVCTVGGTQLGLDMQPNGTLCGEVECQKLTVHDQLQSLEGFQMLQTRSLALARLVALSVCWLIAVQMVQMARVVWQQ